ncbi:HET-domain-containing protein, partial [Polychaeton citri CBS 116435]
MRLLKTGLHAHGDDKLELVERWGRDIPKYAILSHTWSRNPGDEVLFADVVNGTSGSKPAIVKLRKALERAARDGYDFLWVDTCCIDKTSSVELGEAINSMYQYYQNADKCYAFLADVANLDNGFGSSRWWRRGWTLQELLATKNVEFLSEDWRSLGSKAGLSTLIYGATGIDTEYLLGLRPIQHASVAKRMSWAADRETTREEDLAYCLMGIFDVNMFMLYGEGGKRAFLRLQEEIMKVSEDQSIFAWVASEDAEGDHRGMLADSPKDFKHAGSIVPYSELADYSLPSMTARGLHMTLPL